MATPVTLYSGESTGSEDLKLVRLARDFRSMRIRNTHAHISVVGYMSSRLLLLSPDQMDAERSTTEALLLEKRNKLLSLSVPDSAVVVFKPFQLLPIEGRQIVLETHESGPSPQYPSRPDVTPELQPYNPAISPSVIIDPRAETEEGSARAGRSVETQIEVTVWEANGNRKLLPKVSATFNIGPNGFEEAGAEVTALKVKLKNQLFWGVIQNVQFAVKIGAALSFEKSTLTRVIGEWSGKLKSSLAADLNIPGTSIKIPVECSLYVDATGKPGGNIQVTAWEF